LEPEVSRAPRLFASRVERPFAGNGLRRRPLESQLDSVAKRAGEHGPNGRPSRPRKLGTEAMTVNMPIAMYLARIRHDARARFSWVTARVGDKAEIGSQE